MDLHSSDKDFARNIMYEHNQRKPYSVALTTDAQWPALKRSSGIVLENSTLFPSLD